MRFAVAALMLALAARLAAGAPQAEKPEEVAAQVSFQYERPGLQVPKFTLQVNEDGSAHYEAEQVFTASGGGDDTMATQHVDRKLVLTRARTNQIFAAARELNRFNDICASKAKNIADTGKKTLHYTGKGGDGMCVYNYSADKRVLMLTDTFQAIALTLDMGRTLDFDHRFDRLGLDAAMARLVAQAEAGKAIELETIAPTLDSIAQDSEVLERVRSRAARLLQQWPPSS